MLNPHNNSYFHCHSLHIILFTVILIVYVNNLTLSSILILPFPPYHQETTTKEQEYENRISLNSIFYHICTITTNNSMLRHTEHG